MATSLAIQQEALSRATSSQSLANYAAIIRGFMAKGLSESEIKPRENVFTFNAWKALGRVVRKGEHGVKCITVITTKDKRTGREERRPWTTTVFHVSQTQPVGTEYVRVPTPTAPLEINSLDLDATPENIPYAGEEETSTAELLEHSAAVHAIQKFSPDATVETFTLDENCKLVRETPEPPKDSASVRAMRGEQVSIMDIIAELPNRETRETLAQHDRRIDREYRAAKRNVQQVYQNSKTVNF